MRVILRWLLAGLALGSLLFAAVQLKKLAAIMDGLKTVSQTATAVPASALAPPAQAQAIEKMLGINISQLVSEEKPAAAARVAPEQPRGPVSIIDTNSSNSRVVEQITHTKGTHQPNAVIIDRSTGKRWELISTRRMEDSPKQPKRMSSDYKPPLRSPDDLKHQKRLACGLLLGALTGAAVLLVWARRRLRV